MNEYYHNKKVTSLDTADAIVWWVSSDKHLKLQRNDWFVVREERPQWHDKTSCRSRCVLLWKDIDSENRSLIVHMDSQITKIISLFMRSISYDVMKAENLKTIFSLHNRHNDHWMSTIVMNSYWLIFSLGVSSFSCLHITLWAHATIGFKTKPQRHRRSYNWFSHPENKFSKIPSKYTKLTTNSDVI